MDKPAVERVDDIGASPGDINGSDSGHSKIARRLLLKQDLSIVLILSGCYFFAYLDRGALGNARIMEFQKDLHLDNSQFYNCLLMFFVGYMVAELPAALLLRILPSNLVYALSCLGFGLLAACTSKAGGYAGVMVIRFLLGIMEAAIQTGFVFISLWYQEKEMATRSAFFYISAPIAGAASGLISYGVQKNLNGANGLYSWQWLFIIEGVFSVAWGILTFIVMPRLPEVVARKGSWLFRDEASRELILRRTTQRNAPDAKPCLWQIGWALKDIKTWLGALIIGAASMNIAAFGVFLPTFLHEFGWSPLQTQLYSIIPYACAVVSLPVLTMSSGRVQQKAAFLFGCLSTCVVGYIILLCTTKRAACLFACCLVAIGSYPGVVLGASFLLLNQAGYTKRATAWAVTQIFIQCYSIIATQVYTSPPRYLKGHGVLVGLNFVAVVAIAIKSILMKRSNAQRDAADQRFQEEGTADPEMVKSLEELCDYHPSFRYVL
ncbi:hypothetical protein M409DRAFT_61982 [Zasmidium cellare ATCC 36951]|uniref:Major facilitator superfamily (MFS) profile domain-containing protein n=1 Tax=Zasmidium cellare ATCC 36951 TaxID=1080233 RepID=A0A6A6D2P7_ZASCE|nr:uncharacterized protein M409DRAFT_61982 [Zasmidium cellare ATCC 36951]KAF2173687.1 hypothetical protein M409DRAFT_61982 [Zasmidium cellare ATCC 36951]